MAIVMPYKDIVNSPEFKVYSKTNELRLESST